MSFQTEATLSFQIGLKDTSDVRVLIVGQIADAGRGPFLTRMNAAKTARNYMVSVYVENLNNSFPSISNSLATVFDLSPIEVEIVSYGGTIKDLFDDIQFCKELEPPGPVLGVIVNGTIADPMSIIPSTETMGKGSWFVGSHTMSEAFTNAKDDNNVPIIAVYGKMATGTERCIIIKKLVLLGGAIRFDGHCRVKIENDTKNFMLDGIVTIQKLAPSNDLAIALSLTLEEKAMAFSVQNTGKPLAEIVKPFGDCEPPELL